MRYKNWKIYFTMEGSSGAAALTGPQTYGWAQVQNIRRDPFEQAVGEEQKSVLSIGGALASPSTAYLYNWNMLPVGQQLWLKELESYVEFPPLQAPESCPLYFQKRTFFIQHASHTRAASDEVKSMSDTNCSRLMYGTSIVPFLLSAIRLR